MVAGISRDQFILECIKDGVVAMVQDPEYQEKRALLAHNEDVAQYAPADEAAAERVRSINVGRDSAWFKALLDEDNQRRRFTDESM